ncbi:uncharacterized protein L201_004234 [Kwoniella dendrophila CBS 6074]|uniref:Peroxin/Ferlin domain-containing protein n=1 Tax=Kwoniella dendrophila CBS 6074 TaxID=1295534 RepID=A0AAX4JWN2_9TREE
MAPTTSIPHAGSSEHPQPVILQSSDLVSSLPAPCLRLLVLFARPIALFKVLLEILFWRTGRRVQSWMVIGAWWSLCLASGHAFRYLLPALIFIPFIPLSTLRLKSSTKQPTKNTSVEPSTSDSLIITLSDINAIYALLPPSPLPKITSSYERFRQLGSLRLVRGLIVIWVTWLMLGQVIGYRTLLGMVGTIVLLLPSPPLAHIVNLLSKSLFIRRSLALAFLFTFGSPPESSYKFSVTDFSPLGWVKSKWTTSRRPSLAFSLKPKMSSLSQSNLSESAIADDDEEGKMEKVEQPIYFKFELHENQRWWMGLDWTSALLPQERPSWCDNHLQPVSPPQSFILPQSTSIIVPQPTVNDPKAKVQRTSNWKWLDDDWHTVKQGPAALLTSTTGGSAKQNQTIPSPTIPQHHDDEHGFTVPNQPQNTGNTTSGGASSRPTSFISTFGSSPPTATGEDTLSPGARAQSIAEQAFTKGLERLKARTASVAANATSSSSSSSANNQAGSSPRKTSDTSNFSFRQRTTSQASDDSHHTTNDHHDLPSNVNVQLPLPGEVIVEKDDATDNDGWVYGDNKWEGMGPKGGLGKFTRRRRWTRRAVLIETVTKIKSIEEPPIIVPPSSATTPGGGREITPTNIPNSPLKAKAAPAPAVAVAVKSTPVDGKGTSMNRVGSRNSNSKRSDHHEDNIHSSGGVTGITTGTQNRDDVLRSRLKKAMGSVGG